MFEKDIGHTHDAMDKSFRYAGDQWAKDFHVSLGLPGEFKKLLQNDTVINPKNGIRMDLLELVEIEDGKDILINIEHQSTKLDTNKIKMIDGYKNYSKCKHKLPLLSVIVSPFPKEEHETEYRSTDSDILQPVFITINDKEIERRLEVLKNNIENDNIENYIVLNIAIISIFVLNKEYEILKELCEILIHSEGIKGKIKSDMTKILEEMIKYKLKQNRNQVMELLEMLDEEREIAKRGMRIWYEEEFAQIEAQHKKELSLKDAELNKRDAELNKRDAEIKINEAQYKKELAEKDELIAMELAKKDAKIAELNALLKSNGVI